VHVPLFGVINFDGEWEGVRRAIGDIDNIAVGGRHALLFCPFQGFSHILQVLGLPLTDAAAATFFGDSAAAAAATTTFAHPHDLHGNLRIHDCTVLLCRIRIRTRLSKQAKGKVTAQPEENYWVRAIMDIGASVRPPHTRVLTCTGIQFS
jgi:hypothetical protein